MSPTDLSNSSRALTLHNGWVTEHHLLAKPRKTPLNLAELKCLDILQIYVCRRDLDFSNSLINLSKHDAGDKEAMCGKHEGLEADSGCKMHKWRANIKVDFVNATWTLGSRVLKSKGWLIKWRGGKETAGVSSRRKCSGGQQAKCAHFPQELEWKPKLLSSRQTVRAIRNTSYFPVDHREDNYNLPC